MSIDFDGRPGDEAYFDQEPSDDKRIFDAELLRQPLSVLPTRSPLIFAPKDTVSAAMRSMQAEHRGCVLVTEDGSDRSALRGIFTERDVLERIIDRGRNPATLTLSEVMVSDHETRRPRLGLRQLEQLLSKSVRRL